MLYNDALLKLVCETKRGELIVTPSWYDVIHESEAPFTRYHRSMETMALVANFVLFFVNPSQIKLEGCLGGWIKDNKKGVFLVSQK